MADEKMVSRGEETRDDVKVLNPEDNLGAGDAVKLDVDDEVGAAGDYPNAGYGATPNYATTDNYADLAVFNKAAFRTGTVAVVNSGAASCQVTFLGSLDKGKTFDVVLAADVAVPAGGSAHQNLGLASHFSHVKVRVRSTPVAAPALPVSTTVKARGGFID